jgi:hypothetical protein
MELFSLLVTLCLLVLMNDPMRGRDPPFIGGEEGCIPWIPSNGRSKPPFFALIAPPIPLAPSLERRHEMNH